MEPFEHGGDVYGNGGIRLDFSVNTNPLGMPEAVQNAIAAHVPDYARYPDPACRTLRKALATHHQIVPEQILCGNGASDLIFRICASLRPNLALTLAPTFSEYMRNVTLFGGKMIEYPLRAESGFLLEDAFLNALTPDIDAVFLCNPNNPTGRLCPFDLILQIADQCKANNTLLALDECFLDFTQGESLLPLLAIYPNLLILKAFTKLYAMAGLRLGYLLSSDAAMLDRIASFGATWSVSAVAQTAGVAALDCADWAERTRSLVANERAYLKKELTRLNLALFPSDANFLLVRGTRPLYAPLLRRRILVRGCDNFSGLDERYFRIGVKNRAENEALLCAVAEVLHG